MALDPKDLKFLKTGEPGGPGFTFITADGSGWAFTINDCGCLACYPPHNDNDEPYPGPQYIRCTKAESLPDIQTYEGYARDFIMNHSREEKEWAAAKEDVAEYEALITSLKAAREHAGLTRKQVAAELHTTEAAIVELERLAGNPTIHQLLQYARAVNLRLTLNLEPEETQNNT